MEAEDRLGRRCEGRLGSQKDRRTVCGGEAGRCSGDHRDEVVAQRMVRREECHARRQDRLLDVLARREGDCLRDDYARTSRWVLKVAQLMVVGRAVDHRDGEGDRCCKDGNRRCGGYEAEVDPSAR